MLPHVTILYRTLVAQAMHPMVILRDQEELAQTHRAVDELMGTLGGLCHQHRNTKDRIEMVDGCHLLFVTGDDLDKLCGVRADLMFTRLSEWSDEERNTLLKPFLAGGVGLQRHRLEQALIKQGLMTNADRYGRLRIDDVLVNLD